MRRLAKFSVEEGRQAGRDPSCLRRRAHGPHYVHDVDPRGGSMFLAFLRGGALLGQLMQPPGPVPGFLDVKGQVGVTRG